MNPEQRKIMLRNTAWGLEGLAASMDYLVTEWPEYAAQAQQVRAVTNRIVKDARQVGYMGRKA